MQTKPQEITPTFAPEMQFNVELVPRTALAESISQRVPSTRLSLVALQDKSEWRGVRFSALND